jgi:hypothetical protein
VISAVRRSGRADLRGFWLSCVLAERMYTATRPNRGKIPEYIGWPDSLCQKTWHD